MSIEVTKNAKSKRFLNMKLPKHNSNSIRIIVSSRILRWRFGDILQAVRRELLQRPTEDLWQDPPEWMSVQLCLSFRPSWS